MDRTQGILRMHVLPSVALRGVVVVAILASVTAAFAQKRSVSLEIIVGIKEEVGIEQRIMTNLEKVGADNLKISRGDPQNAVNIREIEGAATSTIKVTGVYSNRKIFLPGGGFAWTDSTGIADLIQRLRDDGANTALAEKLAFGLTAEQLVAMNEELSVEIAEPTNQQGLAAFVDQVQSSIRSKIVMDKDVASILNESGPVQDDLKGLSAGTALAAALRPYGLVLVPRRQQGGAVELAIMTSRSAREFWPIGWPPEGLIREVAPSLLERLDVEIRDFTLSDTLVALQKRVKLPLLVDRNSLAEKEVELDQVIVTYVKKQAEYLMIFKKIAAQSKPPLSVELRVDEAGKAFLWVY
jgi:hypothetical protein